MNYELIVINKDKHLSSSLNKETGDQNTSGKNTDKSKRTTTGLQLYR